MAGGFSTKFQLSPTKKLLAGNGPAPLLLLAVAAFGWWISAGMAHRMVMSNSSAMSMAGSSLSLLTFVFGWIAMMCAMMFPAIMPVVVLFRGAALRGQAAPTPWFVVGYLLVWSAVGIPAYWAWKALQGPLGSADPWAARIAGTAFLVAAAYQVSPLKLVCLRHCRTPMSFFMRQRHNLRRPLGATSAGVNHATACFGCCWALMAVLVTLGTMQLAWMVILAALIYLEKVSVHGVFVARATALVFVALGASLLLHPAVLSRIT